MKTASDRGFRNLGGGVVSLLNSFIIRKLFHQFFSVLSAIRNYVTGNADHSAMIIGIVKGEGAKPVKSWLPQIYLKRGYDIECLFLGQPDHIFITGRFPPKSTLQPSLEYFYSFICPQSDIFLILTRATLYSRL